LAVSPILHNALNSRLTGGGVPDAPRQKGEISYDLEHRALNYSMGRPRMPIADVAEEAAVLAANAGAAPKAEAGAAVLEAEAEKVKLDA
jgi:hypothetical protein